MQDLITELRPGDEGAWQSFVLAHSGANYCHDIAWLRIIRRTYGKEPAYLLHRDRAGGRIKGVLPAFYLSSLLFGRRLVSLPYLDWGGILTDDEDAEPALLQAFLRAAGRRSARSELRCTRPLAGITPPSNEKVGMILDLDGLDESSYWKKLDPKVRNQVRKAEKSGVEVRWGGLELLPDFYSVFSRNMRDLGSPVHSKSLFSNLLEEMPGAELGTAHRSGRCIGGLVSILWRDMLAIPWASTLRDERIYCPNNALYWERICFALRNRCLRIDLGRSSRGEGTYRFKLQWLARESLLPWYDFDDTQNATAVIRHTSSGRLAFLAGMWSRLPLGLANALGPLVRSMIPA